LTRHHLIAIALSLAVSYVSETKAQEDYRFEAGGGIGMTGYLGDANTSSMWNLPSYDAEILFRYIANPRWAFKTGIYIGGLKGDSSKTTNVFPDGQPHKFTCTFYELGEIAEFNFLSYGMGETYRRLKRFTPYIAAGLGMTVWSVGKKAETTLVIPFGLGFRYKPSRRVNLGLEFLMKKTFSDRLDGPELDDPIGIESSFMKNTDWYSTLTLTVSYEFSKRCATCNYKD